MCHFPLNCINSVFMVFGLLYSTFTASDTKCIKQGKGSFVILTKPLFDSFSQTHKRSIALSGNFLHQILPAFIKNVYRKGTNLFMSLLKVESQRTYFHETRTTWQLFVNKYLCTQIHKNPTKVSGAVTMSKIQVYIRCSYTPTPHNPPQKCICVQKYKPNN
jgi:hypothetical protein